MEPEKIIKKNRHSIRLPGYDYSAEGSYFITLVTHEREHLFGSVADGEMRLNDYGVIVREEWVKTKEYRPNIEIIEDEFVIMPNHFHGIILLMGEEMDMGMADKGDLQVARKGTARRALTNEVFGQPRPGSLATIIGAYKSAVTKRINLLRGTPCAKVWLRNYYEHIIRSEKDYEAIVNYIYLNPMNWDLKDEYSVRTGVHPS